MHRLTRTRIALTVLLVSAAMLGAAVAALVARAGATAGTNITVTERDERQRRTCRRRSLAQEQLPRRAPARKTEQSNRGRHCTPPAPAHTHRKILIPARPLGPASGGSVYNVKRFGLHSRTHLRAAGTRCPAGSTTDSRAPPPLLLGSHA